MERFDGTKVYFSLLFVLLFSWTVLVRLFESRDMAVKVDGGMVQIMKGGRLGVRYRLRFMSFGQSRMKRGFWCNSS
jgi:hypothetical protein